MNPLARYGVFTNIYKACYLVRDGAVARLEADVNLHFATHNPGCLPARVESRDTPYSGTPGVVAPVTNPRWLAMLISDSCPNIF